VRVGKGEHTLDCTKTRKEEKEEISEKNVACGRLSCDHTQKVNLEREIKFVKHCISFQS
jgi:uncharacterized cysteine cluster protein YcgN (CxxCxxCC family)